MNRTTISELKLAAKDQLLGNYRIAAGSFALLFVLIYVIMSVIMSAFTYSIGQSMSATGMMSLAQEIEASVLGMVIGAISVTFSVGYIHIMKKITNGEQAVLSDLFFTFRNHPDKVIIISLIMTGIQFVLLLPATFAAPRDLDITQGFDGKRMFLWAVLYLSGLIISFVIDLMFAMCFMIYLDDPDESVPDILRTSVDMMKGNKFRYFYMLLSFIGYWILGILSLGIAFVWVVPYQTMTTVVFYQDLKKSTGDNWCEV